MMQEESREEFLLSYLQTAGVSIPDNVSSITDFTPATFVSVCSQCLNLMDAAAAGSPLPTSLPASTIDKFKMCTDIALAIKRLGYIGEMTYYKLLYPSEEDLYKVARFLVDKLSKSSVGAKLKDLKDVSAKSKTKDGDNLESPNEKTDNGGLDLNLYEENVEDLNLRNVVLESNSEDEEASFSCTRTENVGMDGSVLAEEEKLRGGVLENEEAAACNDDIQKMISPDDKSSKIRYETENLHNQEKLLMEEMTLRTAELQHLEEQFELLKAAAEMAFDDKHSIDYYLDQLNEQIHARKCTVAEVISQGDALGRVLEDKKRRLLESVYATIPEAPEKIQKLLEVELEKQSALSQMRKLEQEHSKLLAELVKQPKLPPRTSYIERIKEITKNSRKQDADIQRIVKETRELQLESNSIQERLHRTYTVLDEIVLREAKKDLVGRQAYRLLTSIHDSFEQISEKILATDRIHREMAKLEKKLTATASRSLNVDKLRADLEAIKRENENLEQRLEDN
ncbi:hypothetical protein Tsubulata_038780 [Turnera subulata]|uniref:Coiled-coil domain-containing protein 22 homolog n=1 Tax=Turnera subulata TaxID=218843 RepID=A0A9Q0J707_9ROSI|nr:hypothetical protein Tsubulata_038780 [Turnera subulata]